MGREFQKTGFFKNACDSISGRGRQGALSGLNHAHQRYNIAKWQKSPKSIVYHTTYTVGDAQSRAHTKHARSARTNGVTVQYYTVTTRVRSP